MYTDYFSRLEMKFSTVFICTLMICLRESVSQDIDEDALIASVFNTGGTQDEKLDGTQGGTRGVTPDGTQGGTQDVAQGGTAYGTQGGTQDVTQGGTAGGTQGGTSDGTQDVTQGGTADGTQDGCTCVPYYQCSTNRTFIENGEGLIDIRYCLNCIYST
jgi:hypothetical protein